MTAELVVLLVVVVTALAFDFTNGFHDTGNAMATSIATGALKPKVAVILSAVLNLVGAFLSVEVAATVAKGVVDLGSTGGEELLTIVFAGLVGGILWNLATWLFGLPSSSSHALFGGLIGAALAAIGIHGVVWDGVLGKVIIPRCSPPRRGGARRDGRHVVRASPHARSSRRSPDPRIPDRSGRHRIARVAGPRHQRRQKTMGVIFLALVAHGSITADARCPSG